MELLNQWVINSDKFVLPILVLFIIFIGLAFYLFYLTKKINNLN